MFVQIQTTTTFALSSDVKAPNEARRNEADDDVPCCDREVKQADSAEFVFSPVASFVSS